MRLTFVPAADYFKKRIDVTFTQPLNAMITISSKKGGLAGVKFKLLSGGIPASVVPPKACLFFHRRLRFSAHEAGGNKNRK